MKLTTVVDLRDLELISKAVGNYRTENKRDNFHLQRLSGIFSFLVLEAKLKEKYEEFLNESEEGD